MTLTLDEGYRAMAADAAREGQAQEWCNALLNDIHVDAWRDEADPIVCAQMDNARPTGTSPV
jgi:hypothetical protein